MSIDTTLGIIGAILGILGIVTGYLFYKLSIRAKEPCWVVKSNNLIENNVSQLSGLDILFKGEKVNSITVSKFIFWNKGAEAINREDIVKADPLRLEGKGNAVILDAIILETTNKSNQFNLSVDRTNNIVLMDFEYLNKQNGVLLQVVHTGTDRFAISVEGSLKGVDQILELKETDTVNVLYTAATTATSFLIWITAFSILKPIQEYITLKAPELTVPGTSVLVLLLLLISWLVLRPLFYVYKRIELLYKTSWAYPKQFQHLK